MSQAETTLLQSPQHLETNPFLREARFAAENPTSREYLINQAKTTLIEAVYPGATNYSIQWNGKECVVPGLGSIEKTLQNGYKVAVEMGDRYAIEADRRQKELQEQSALNMLLQRGALNEQRIAFTLSPAPIDTIQDPQLRQELGYTDRGKVRIYMHNGNDVIAHELFVTGDLDWWKNLAKELGAQVDDTANSTDLMQLHVMDVANHASFMKEILEKVYGNEAPEIVAKSNKIEKAADDLAQEVADFDRAMGEELRNGAIAPETVAKRKERLLMQCIAKLSAKTGLGRFGYLENQSAKINWSYFLRSMPIQQVAVCGMLLNSSQMSYVSPFQMRYEQFRSYTFGGEKKIVQCPGCNNDVLIANRAARSIACPHCNEKSDCPEAIYSGAQRTFNEFLRGIPALQEVTYTD